MLNKFMSFQEMKITNRILAVLLIITLSCFNFIFLGMHITKGLFSYATESNITNSTDVDNVNFEIFFIENNEKTNSITKDINAEDAVLNAIISVKNGGVLNNAQIKFLDANFKIKNSVQNTINIGTIQSGENRKIEIPIESIYNEKLNINLLNMISNVELTGVYTDNNAQNIEVNSEKQVRLVWGAENAELSLLQEVITNKIYSVNGENKRVIQAKVISKVNNNKYPVKESIINICNPIEAEAEGIVVASHGTYATNGKTCLEFEPTEWQYNTESSKVEITLKNEKDEENKISWQKQTQDEFVVTFVYPESADVSIISTKANSAISLYDNRNTKLTKEISASYENLEEINSVLELESTCDNTLYKGNMKIGEETQYKTAWALNINYINYGTEEIIIKDVETNQNLANIYYKNTYINKDQALDILGESGTISLYKVENDIETLIETIEMSTLQEDINIQYAEPIKNLKVQTSTPTKEGILNFVHTKYVEGKNYTNEELNNINRITNLVELENFGQKQNEIELRNTVTSTNFGTDNTTLSVTEQNEINFTITLKTSDIKYELYKDPTIEIELPEKVTSINITEDDITILNGNGLEIDTLEIKNNKILLELKGEQLSYQISDTQINLRVNVETEKLLPSSIETINLRVTNSKTTEYESGGEDFNFNRVNINLVAERGFILASSVTGYNSANDIITSFKNDVQTGELETETTTKTIRVKNTLINNDKKTEGIKILGKLKAEGTTIDLELLTEVGINKENVQVLYSEEENATLESTWVSQATSASKSYLITVGSINERETVEFLYDAKIPENLQTNESLYITYDVYSNEEKVKTSRIALETQKETKLSVELESSVEENDVIFEGQKILYTIKVTNIGDYEALEVSINNELPEGVLVGKKVETNEQGEIVVKEDESSWDNITIAPRETIIKTVEGTIGDIETGESATILNKVTINAKYLPQQIIKTVENTAKKTDLRVNTNYTIYGPDTIRADYAQIGSKVTYLINIANKSDTNDYENVIIQNTLPEVFKYDEIYVLTSYKVKVIEEGEEKIKHEIIEVEDKDIQYEEEENKLNINLGNLEKERNITIQINGTIENYREDILENSISINCEQTLGENTLKENIKIPAKTPANISAVLSSTKADSQVKAGEEIEYVLKIQNNGESNERMDLESNSIKELQIKEAYIKKGTEATINNVQEELAYSGGSILYLRNRNLEEGEILQVRIIATANQVETQKEIINFATIKGDYIGEIQTNLIRNIIIHNPELEEQEDPEEPINPDNPDNPQSPEEPDNPVGPENPNDPSNPEQTERYTISGLAWEDKNEDGKRNEEEKVLPNITVKIINANTNEYVVDKDNNDLEVKTDNSGKYEFLNLEKGKYIIVFEYNSKTYKLTTTKKDGVGEGYNSDATTIVTQEGSFAITETLEITDNSIYNIDIGLIVKPIFDLELNKSITKVTVKNSSGTNIYNFDKTNMAKVEIPAKNLLGSMVVVEYTIGVTNKGLVPGYAKNIVDYMSPELEFNSELNENWYKGTDNNLYCLELTNDQIKPGETKEVKLVLTKSMTENNLGLVNNVAEIYEDYNEYAIEDVNSTPANKEEKENDLSSASIIISLKTGGTILYIGIALVCMAILSIGIYIIDKKVLKDKI